MNYEPVIGLEVHVQLKTKTKVFCGCSTEFGNEPNSQVCPVCLGFPGSLPVLNRAALDHAIKAGLALNCTVAEYTKFDRKHYYYPDLPKNIQISQYDLPVSKDGYLDIEIDGRTKRIRIRRAHLEEDAGKLIHKETTSLIDYNRTGQPLLEIVSEPDMNSPEEAYEYLTDLKSVIQYTDVSDCDMEKGTLRCDANISLRPAGTTGLGVKSELKNLNSFKAVREALAYEIERHRQILNEGGQVVQETRLWDEKTGQTLAMRTKEEAKDYRYFPEPDLPPFTPVKEEIDRIKKEIPELPKEKCRRFMKEHGLGKSDAQQLTLSMQDAEFAEAVIRAFPGANKKPAVNWLIGPLASEANARNRQMHELGVSPEDLVELVRFMEDQEISNLAAKTVLSDMIDTHRTAAQIVKEKNLIQISDESSIENDIDAVIAENPKVVNDLTGGRSNALMFLVGQVMKRTKGKANPKVVQDMLKRRFPNV
ncbi:MAG TPA: Asp-tRNA(Asn)/Glu-tRNA(Gln) amidotransferase subunit GatB [Candidatus Omnitrophota bacterium]|nr:Asp-tRNA(Asn)/Glu-tRNA(Gln) amidotransferase subunit GatB [Candidatus Omnitrophota bacterium]